MEHYLVKFYSDYADEFEVYGFAILNRDDYIEWFTLVNYLKESDKNYCDFDYNFGTNEFITFDNWKEYSDSFTTSIITEEEYKFLIRVFNSHYGFIPIDLPYERNYELESESDRFDDFVDVV